ncbi:MAG: hypothetical protein V4638_03320 [Bacteroidota bacterium]
MLGLETVQAQKNVEWSDFQRTSSSLLQIIPKSGKDFYALRWSGSAVLGKYKLAGYNNLSLSATGKIMQVADNTMAAFHDIVQINDRIFVFLTDKKDGQNHIYIQEYDQELQAIASPQHLAAYDIDFMKDRGLFEVIQSKNKDYFAVIWQVEAKKGDKDSYGFKIYDKIINLVSEGDYKLPYNSELSFISDHHLANDGNYFISVVEHNEPDKGLFKSQENYKATHILQINEDGIETFTLDLTDRRIEAMELSDNGDQIFTLTGVYGAPKSSGVSGLFYMRINFAKKEVINEGFQEFGADFITQDWTDREREKADRRAEKGKGEPQLFDYVVRQTEVLKDGSVVGSLEQYYIRSVQSYNSQTRTYTTLYYYYYNDIIAFKVGVNGGFDWLKKISKYQVSINDGGPFSSYSRFINDGKLCFIFNDHVRNYDEMGNFTPSKNVVAASFAKKKNVVAMVEMDLQSGEYTRRTFFDRSEITALSIPKAFVVDNKTNQLLLYAIYGRKERFGILNIND